MRSLSLKKRDAEVKKILTYDIDLIEAWQGGLLKFNKDLSVDVGILKLRSFIDKNKKKEIQKPIFISSSIDLFSDQHIAKYDTLDKAEDILFFGYPVLPTLKQVDKTHSLDPLIRRGMISKKLDAKKFIIDGFVSKGSSGSPVFLRREFVMPLGGFRIELKFIGLITRYFPYYADKESEANDTQNAGLALVESVDNIADTLIEFDVQIAEKEKKAKE